MTQMIEGRMGGEASGPYVANPVSSVHALPTA